MDITKIDALRFKHQISLDMFGIKSQARLSKCSVLIVGTGGLGSSASLYLASSGIGTLGLIDGDVVSISNLQRQILYDESRLDHKKIIEAKNRLIKLNSSVNVDVYDEFLSQKNAERIILKYDFIIDCTDNVEAKFLINDTCLALYKPFSHAGVSGYGGQLITVLPKKTACLRCVFGDNGSGEEDSSLGILAPVPGVIGSLQAIEAIKYITSIGNLLVNKLLVFDALTLSFKELDLSTLAACKH